MTDSPKKEIKGLKFFTEYVPLLVFLLVYWKSDLITATKAIVAVTILTTAVSFFITRKVAMLPLVTAGILAFFGGLTIIFEDESFIKMKPTIVQIVFAGLLGGGLFFDKIWIKKMMGHSIEMPDQAWKTMTVRLCLFFLICAGLNELVWRTQSTDFWVSFKVFGLTGLTFVFFAAQIPFFNKHLIENEPHKE